MMEVAKMIYQILLEVAIVYIAVRYPEHESILMMLCTWLLILVIRERR